jgi:hypothetical protein
MNLILELILPLVRPDTNMSTSLVISSRPVGEAASLLPAPNEMRHWRRGESKCIKGSYHQASVDETLDIIDRLERKTLKWTELDKLYADGQTRVSGGSMRKYFYGKDAASKRAALEEKREFSQMGAPRQVSNERAIPHLPSLICHSSSVV